MSDSEEFGRAIARAAEKAQRRHVIRPTHTDLTAAVKKMLPVIERAAEQKTYEEIMEAWGKASSQDVLGRHASLIEEARRCRDSDEVQAVLKALEQPNDR